MLILKHKTFADWAKDEGLSDSALLKAVHEMEEGLYEANLGSGLFKKRIARKGEGKRGGYRTLLAFQYNNMAIFLYGFAKNQKDNINEKEKEIFKGLAKIFVSATEDQLSLLIQKGELVEINK